MGESDNGRGDGSRGLAEVAPVGWRASSRAALIGLHLLLVTSLGLPEPQVEDEDLQNEFVQEWFDETTETLHRWGLDVSREQVESWSITWGQRYLAVRTVLTGPGRYYASWCGTSQSWRMFASVPHESAVFFVEAKDEDGWKPVGWSRYKEPHWRKDWVDQERVRALFNQFTHKKNRAAWDRLGRFLLPWLKEDFPDATAFRMGMQKVSFPPPEQLALDGKLVWKERFWVTSLPKAGSP